MFLFRSESIEFNGLYSRIREIVPIITCPGIKRGLEKEWTFVLPRSLCTVPVKHSRLPLMPSVWFVPTYVAAFSKWSSKFSLLRHLTYPTHAPQAEMRPKIFVCHDWQLVAYWNCAAVSIWLVCQISMLPLLSLKWTTQMCVLLLAVTFKKHVHESLSRQDHADHAITPHGIIPTWR